jgi:uncharacterized YccA/Bax inhibitor family protein
VIAATGGIALLYLVSMVMSMFGKPIGFIHEAARSASCSAGSWWSSPR